MNRFSFLLLHLVLVGCHNYGQLSVVTDLPKKLRENSGMAMFGANSVWMVEDSGNKDIIYEVDFNGDILTEFKVKNAKNEDWEDLTSDEEGNLYIGDFGNNDNRRKDLVIYKVPNPNMEPGDKIDAERIEFRYPEQKAYPPDKEDRVYDSEAFFHLNGFFYIFTKNRADPFLGEVSIYRVPAVVGKHNATLLGTITTCDDWDSCQVTAADVSPDGKTVVLLGYGKLWILTDYKNDAFGDGRFTEIDLGVRTQLESVCFKDDHTLLLSDEVRDKEGGLLYTYTLK